MRDAKCGVYGALWMGAADVKSILMYRTLSCCGLALAGAAVGANLGNRCHGLGFRRFESWLFEEKLPEQL